MSATNMHTTMPITASSDGIDNNLKKAAMVRIGILLVDGSDSNISTDDVGRALSCRALSICVFVCCSAQSTCGFVLRLEGNTKPQSFARECFLFRIAQCFGA